VQDEEDAAATALAVASLRVRDAAGGPARAAFAAQVDGYVSKAVALEDELAQALALSCMDLHAMSAAAADAAALSAELGERPAVGHDEALALELLLWFKRSFFSWVDRPPCGACGSAATASAGGAPPSLLEAAHGAARVEVYRCAACAAATRFPRYNDAAKLLETRRGRCGEWANCFALCCRAAGLEARLVGDWTDHCWVEYYSDSRKRWVHLDPCEAAADTPLLYEVRCCPQGCRGSRVVGGGGGGAARATITPPC
jgi:peptide-N4-(N-acetyl-beta-glucosaminyl)asparagine amidase